MTPEASGGQFPWRTQRSVVPTVGEVCEVSSSTLSVGNGARSKGETQTQASILSGDSMALMPCQSRSSGP